jgi:hypothetical protein
MARRQISDRTPKVGIIFLVGHKLLIDATPVSDAEDYGEFKIHDLGHDRYWDRLVKKSVVPGSDYEEYPRGRVVFNKKTHQHTLYLDRCILKKLGVVKKIMSEMSLPPNNTKISRDEHYRCPGCSPFKHSEHAEGGDPA